MRKTNAAAQKPAAKKTETKKPAAKKAAGKKPANDGEVLQKGQQPNQDEGEE